MKRVEAIALAIEVVEKSDMDIATKEQVVHQLRICGSRVAQIRWDEKSILAYCDEVYDQRGKLTSNDFDHAGQPYKKIIRETFGMTISQFRDAYSPTRGGIGESSQYSGRTIEELTEAFVQDFILTEPRSMNDYNARKTPGVPSWITIARYHGFSKWSELMEHLGLEYVVKEEGFEVDSFSPAIEAIISFRRKHPIPQRGS